MNRTVALLSLVLSLVACGGRTSPPSLGLEAGVTDHMQRTNAAASFWVDHAGATQNPFADGRSSVRLAERDTITVDGWAIDEPHGNVAAGVEVVIDGTPYRAKYDIPRGDVATAKGSPAYTTSGFTVSFPARGLGRGMHTLALRIVASDRSCYYSTPEWSIVIQ